ncbi:hypothetical protein [Mycobacterium sp. D16R24]|uniref:hypothetical protein n=1 Tax=Mycobacterium sp. D16R24 TaxID=1855656 RepID=UPI0025712EE7|nr:hypothetical protein [Mycobacterium sp. D16R24]
MSVLGGLATLREPVTRHRGGGRDENGQLIDATDTALVAIAVAPGGGVDRIERGRDGEDIACVVYFDTGTDIVNSDELTVRGERFQIIVNDWRSMPILGGLEVLCKRGQG